MDTTERIEARLDDTNNVLVLLSALEDARLPRDFFGSVLTLDDASARPGFSQKTVYLCGDISRARGLDLTAAARVFVIRELSHGDCEDEWSLVSLGQVPMRVHGVGVYYRRFFDAGVDYFNRIRTEHAFQSLTESTKPGTAHRTGIYLTPVHQDGEGLHFRLLRCSTNLSGPTENFRANDRHLVDALNHETAFVFKRHAPLNHVLAQIYRNTPAAAAQKQTKAKISAHADKTKDMPEHGIMAFCTFYDRLDALNPLPDDPFDYGYKGNSALTRLRFCLKEPNPLYPAQFTLTLYPGSVFFMPLSTNRLYTHEIQSSMLDAQRLPTRLGYVVRCSSAEAVHKDGHTFLKKGEARVKLEPPTAEGMSELRRLYAEENKTTGFIEYGDQFVFSMNQGDYLAPEYNPRDEFRVYTLTAEGDLLRELLASVRFEDLGKGRQGAVLVKTDNSGRVPIVRTTTAYNTPAQRFRSVHERVARQIQKHASLYVGFNNALVERYTDAYTTMGAHSDQALDLADDSFIAILSCYEHPAQASPPRTLVVESKANGDTFEIPLHHNTVVVFSVDTNRRFRHKIVLDTRDRTPENPWLGVTFRTSKTFVRFHDGAPRLADDARLTLAHEEQRREFYQLRRRENHETDFTWPRVTYTVSESDLIPLRCAVKAGE